jgi:hypothetical protein
MQQAVYLSILVYVINVTQFYRTGNNREGQKTYNKTVGL